MNILKLSNEKSYFLPVYTESNNQLELTVSGCFVNEIKSFTTEDLKEVTITSMDGVLVGTYSDMELGDSISYSTTFDQTTFILRKNGTGDLSDKVKALTTEVENIKPTFQTMEALISISETASDKTGYNWKITSIGNVEVLKEYVKNDDPDDQHDGSDYTKPAYYIVGASVEKGKWYCQEEDPTLVWECIKSGTPSSFQDTEYFDIVIG